MREVTRLLRPYSLSLAATAVAFLFTLLVPPLRHRFPFALFIAAAMVSAWHGGLRPGLLTTALATLALAIIYFTLPATPAPDVELDYFPRLGMFVLVGILASFLSHECKRTIQAHERFHLSLSGVGDGLIFTDVEGRVTFLNAIAQSLTGWRQEEAVDKPLELVFSLIHEETQDTLENPAVKVIREGTRIDLAEDASLLSNNGSATPIAGRAAPIRDGGKIIGVSLTFHEAAQGRQRQRELRQKEEEFRAALNSSPAAMLLMDSTGRCVYSNRACQALAGFSLEESLGEGWTRSLHPDDRAVMVAEWLAAAGAGQEYAADIRLHTATAKLRWLHFRSLPMRADNGTLIGHVATIEDRTCQKQAEQGLQAAESRFQTLQRTYQDLEKRLQERSAELAQTQTALQKQAHDREQAEERHRQSEEQVRRELEKRFQEQTTELQEAKATLQERVATLLEAEQDFRQELETKQQGPENHIEELSAELAKAQAALQEQAAARQQLERRIEGLTAELARANASLREQMSSSAQTEESLRQSQTRLQGLLEERTAEFLQANVSLQDKIDAAQQAEQKLQRERDLLESLINCSVDGILAFDREFRLSFWNPAMERIAGVTRSSLLGRSVFEVFPSLRETGEDRYFLETLEGKSARVQSGAFCASGNGRRELFETSFAPLLGQSAEIVGGLAVVRTLPESTVEANGQASPDNGPTGLLAEDDLAQWLSFN